MELFTQKTSADADLQEEVRRLRRQLVREQARRRAAETIGERATTELYRSVRELRNAHTELLERADQSDLVNQIARSLRQDLDAEKLVGHAAESVGRATRADRCDVLLIDDEPTAAVRGSWSAGPAARALPRAQSFVDLPEALATHLIEAAQHLEPVRFSDFTTDPRFTPEEVEELRGELPVGALAAVPVAVGDEVVGWMLLYSLTPRSWREGELAVCTSIAHDLVTALIQVRAFEGQRQSVQRLEELDRAKDAFVSTVSHELRTPLTSIVGYLELIADGGMGELPEGVAAGVKIVERNVGRLRGLVEDLLSLSAYDAGKVHLELVDVDLIEVAQECGRTLTPMMDARGITLEVEESGPRLVRADATQIERMVLNVMTNAVKFSHDGGTVDVRVAWEGRDPGEVVLTVADSGIGIPLDEQDRLFERFFRSRLSTTGEVQGTGLGLALVGSIVDSHGGQVSIESAEGVGTTVSVRLPAADV